MILNITFFFISPNNIILAFVPNVQSLLLMIKKILLVHTIPVKILRNFQNFKFFRSLLIKKILFIMQIIKNNIFVRKIEISAFKFVGQKRTMHVKNVLDFRGCYILKFE